MSKEIMVTNITTATAAAMLAPGGIASEDWEAVEEVFREAYQISFGEYNDKQTRDAAIALTKPFCDMFGFSVVCDEQNNSPELIDKYGFAMTFSRGGISRTYTAVVSSVDFSEIEKEI